MRVVLSLASVLLLAVPACGDDGMSTGDDDPTPDAGGNPDDLIELIGRDWTIPAGSEVYKCIGIEVEEEMYIDLFHTPNPTGEHHAVLTITDQLGGFGNTQLGEYDCGVNTLDLEMMYASGVGTDDLVMPEGVAIKIEAGRFLHLNLHLFNTHPTDEISAHSGIFGRRVDPVAPAMEAEMVFAGTFEINVPPMSTATASGGCTFNDDATIFTYWPHMHQAANHQKVTLNIDGADQVIHDEAFDFREQYNFPLSPAIQVSSGDSIDVECTYYNDSDQAITFGDSSTQEMCFTGMYRYPKQAFTLFDCAEGAGGGF
jgi:hypothetical protein